MMTLLLLLLPIKCFAAWSIDDIPNVHVADSTRYVSNPSGVLSEAAVRQLDATFARIWQTTTAEPVLVAIDSADSDDIDAYATDLFEKWGIGKGDKDNGLLILISRDQRKAVIRTGKGMEGVLPDVYASRIIRNVMAPAYREGNYDQGTVDAVNAVEKILSDPSAAKELTSKQRNNSARQQEELSLTQFFTYYFYFGLFLAGCMLIAWIVIDRRTKMLSPHQRYERLGTLKMPALMLGVFGCGVPFIIFWLVNRQMKRIRLTARLCPSCHTKMNRLDEVTDNNYLTAPQNTEEALHSVDYDVWLCPKCNATTVEPYVNKASGYETCDLCHTRAARLMGNKVVRQPSTTRQGEGIKMYHCSHCNNNFSRSYPIAKLPPVIVAPIGGGGGGGGFSGGGGGSFGGGSTMGGGASGSW